MAVGRPEDVVFIEWLDAGTDRNPGWKEESELDAEPVLSTTTGWILKKTKHVIIVVGSKNDGGQYDGDVTIPRKWITKIKKWGEHDT